MARSVDAPTMNRAAILAVLAAVLATAGVCYVTFGRAPAARIDGSSEAAFKSSLDVVSMALPAEQRDKFEAAMTAHARVALLQEGARDNLLAGVAALSADKDGPARRLRGRLDGLTAQQVMSTAPSGAGDAGGAGAGTPFNGDLLQARRDANEAAAIATLKNISAAQAQCQASGVIDVNSNGQGEYGFFGELSGRAAVRASTLRILPPVLSSAFGNVRGARVTRSGYMFQVFLPGVAGAAVAEDASGGDGTNDNGVDPSSAETMWCCYAWPTTCGDSGDRAFFINQAGDVLAARNATAKYSGTDNPPQPMSAFLAGEKDMGGMIAANSTGTDGEDWVVVN